MSGSQWSDTSGKNPTTKTIAITSGKGGVGKTTIAVNLSCELRKRGNRVLILDGDLGMANVDIMFGIRPKFNISNVFFGNKSIEDIIVTVEEGLDLLPAGSGIQELQHLSVFQKQSLLDQVSTLKKYDYLVIDTAPGIAEHVLYLNAASQRSLVVLTPEPASLADSYALIKVLNSRYKKWKFDIVVNEVSDEIEGINLYKKLSDITDRFLNISINLMGCIPYDSGLKTATKSQQLILRKHPFSPASQSFRSICNGLSRPSEIEELRGGIQFFWESLVGVA